MASICIIPARGGSKRIPRKNIRFFLGKPIIAYSIEAALLSGEFEEIMVSTDDREIADIAKQYGATTPFFRSAKNSDDFATTSDVLEEVLLNYRKAGNEFKHACCLYPTAPFATSTHFKEGKKALIENEVDSIFPIVRFEYPIWRGLKKNENGRVELVWDEYRNSRSQDLDPVFHDAGQWYWFNVNTFLESKTVFAKNSIGIELSPLEVQDIDNDHDWNLAEMKYAYLQSLK